LVANKTGYVNYDVDITNLRLNHTYSGPMADGDYSEFSASWPIPATNLTCSAGHGILDAVKKTYGSLTPSHNYTTPYPVDEKNDYNTNVTATRKSSSNTTSTASSSSSSSATGAAVAATVPSVAMTGAMVALFAYLI
jgi:acid phosphatase